MVKIRMLRKELQQQQPDMQSMTVDERILQAADESASLPEEPEIPEGAMPPNPSQGQQVESQTPPQQTTSLETPLTETTSSSVASETEVDVQGLIDAKLEAFTKLISSQIGGLGVSVQKALNLAAETQMGLRALVQEQRNAVAQESQQIDEQAAEEEQQPVIGQVPVPTQQQASGDELAMAMASGMTPQQMFWMQLGGKVLAVVEKFVVKAMDAPTPGAAVAAEIKTKTLIDQLREFQQQAELFAQVYDSLIAKHQDRQTQRDRTLVDGIKAVASLEKEQTRKLDKAQRMANAIGVLTDTPQAPQLPQVQQDSVAEQAVEAAPQTVGVSGS